YCVDVIQIGVLLLDHGARTPHGLLHHLVDGLRHALATTHRLTLERHDLVRKVVGVLERSLPLRRARERQRSLDDGLRMALAHVDDVDDLFGVSEAASIRMRLTEWARGVERSAAWLSREAFEHQPLEETGLPELVADVLCDVHGAAVRAQ